jgi:hypothetical protein
MGKRIIIAFIGCFALGTPILSSAGDLGYSLSGRILLQVESHGEAWYVNPTDYRRYYLGRPGDAFTLMRSLGLGIKHDELVRYQSSSFPSRLVGRILLDVEQSGEAYYISPRSQQDMYLGRPAQAFEIMKSEGLGISNTNLEKITAQSVATINFTSSQEQCLATGGRWQITGLKGDYGCVQVYADGGKYCTSSNQCQKDCIINYGTTQGVCQESGVIMNCHQTIEEYNAGGAFYCQ